MTAHDGFTLTTWSAYNDKHNDANGEGNRDGTDNNLSSNHGVEGPSEDPAICALRLRQKPTCWPRCLLSQGTPMIVAGDEFGRTQHGNNNAYAQDNEISWVDWEGIAESGRALTRFVALLVRLRRQKPLLRRGRFLSGAYNEELEVKDVTWLTAAGTEMTPEIGTMPTRVRSASCSTAAPRRPVFAGAAPM